VSAPAYDEEHPDELHYRPFSLGPLLTASASPDDPLLARMVEPDPVATLAMLDHELSALPMRFTPQHEVAAAMWTHQFTGSAVNFGAITERLAAAKRPESTRPLSPRAVRTSAK